MFRTLDTSNFTKPADAQPGPVPDLRWLPVHSLVVDPAYQREIGRRGRSNVQAIADGFDWCKFAPVIVATLEGGKYAIVDGQHRTTAATLIGLECVPCQVIIANRAKQAQAFAAVNGAVTKTTPLQIYHAKVAANDRRALEIQEICDIAQVTIVKKHRAGQEKKGETASVGAIARCLSLYGRDTLITALQCVTQTGDGNAGWLRASVIEALCKVLHARFDWREAGSNLLQTMDDFDYEEVWDKAMRQSSSILAAGFQQELVQQMTDFLDARLRTSVVPASVPDRPRKSQDGKRLRAVA